MISNKEVLQRMKEKEMYNSIAKQKMAYAGHVLCGSSGDSALQILEGKIEGKLYQGRPRRMWLDELDSKQNTAHRKKQTNVKFHLNQYFT